MTSMKTLQIKLFPELNLLEFHKGQKTIENTITFQLEYGDISLLVLSRFN